MSISINNNNGIIEVSQNGSVPKSYFKASGKFYPSGTTSTVINNIPASPFNLPGFRLISNTLEDLIDDTYFNVPSTTTSVYPSLEFVVSVFGGVIGDNGMFVTSSNISGYSIGDLITIEGSDLGGTGSITFEVTQLEIDGLLIVIDGDFYQVKWYDLVIDSISPTSLGDAQQLLAVLFSTI